MISAINFPNFYVIFSNVTTDYEVAVSLRPVKDTIDRIPFTDVCEQRIQQVRIVKSKSIR